MSVTNYTIEKCKYIRSKLKDVLYLVSEEHIKNIHIDGDEVYIDGLTELPLRINGFNILLNEETSLDERYKFQKTLTLSMNGYVNYKIFGGRYYAIVEDIEGVFYMINVDFPSRITHTFNLSKDTNQTDFTFASLSNFPTMKLNAEFEAVEPVCLGLRVNGIEKLELLEREKAVLDTENKKVISTEDFKVVEFLGNSCTFQEVYDGFKVTDTITFELPLNNKLQWGWHLLEFLDNRYASIITPKGGDNKYYPGFNFGLQPNYTIQTASQNGQSDIITVTLVEMSSYGATAAKDWDDDQDTETRWRWVKKVNDIICYECIGLGKARYLVKQEVDAFGVPTGDYQVMEGYESQYPVFHIVGTFTEQQIFDTNDCGDESSCTITSDIPATVVFTSTTCNTYSLSTTCDWEITDIPSHITVSPTSGVANSSYTVTICNTLTPSSTPLERNISLKCCRNIRLINTKVMQGDNTCLKPSIKQINCLGQTVTFTYNGSCQINVTSIDPSLTYQVGYNTLTVQVPRNYGTSAITWNITYSNCNCNPNSETVSIIQDKQYERWIEDSGYICDSGNSYHVEVKYTGTTADNINTRTPETRKGSLIQEFDSRCGSQTKWEWDNESYTCVDGNKYKLLYEYISTDGGTTWTKTGNTMVGDLVEEQSSYCQEPIEYKWVLTDQWVCGSGDTPTPPTPPIPTGTKFYATYSGGTTYSAECDSSSILTASDTRPLGYNKTLMETAIVGTCVTDVDFEAFVYCGILTSVTIPSTVTTIGGHAFSYCKSLTSITIPSSVTSIGWNDIEEGRGYTFEYCSGLTSINIPNSVTYLAPATFYECSGLTNATIGSGVTSIGDDVFYNCTSLTSVTIGSSVTSIVGSFRGCTSLTSIGSVGSGASVEIPNSVTTIGEYAFGECSGLMSIVIPSGVTTLGMSAFYRCSSLTSVTISNSVTSIEHHAFQLCTGLTSIYIPYSVTSIGEGAFSSCSGLTSVTVNATTPPTLGYGAFDDTNNCPIYVPSGSVNTYKTTSIWSNYSSRITAIPNS